MKRYRIEYYTLENGQKTWRSEIWSGTTAKDARETFIDFYSSPYHCRQVNPRMFNVKAVPLKLYFELPTDDYGQPDGTIRSIYLSKDEYRALEGTGRYIFDNYIAAAYRADA